MDYQNSSDTCKEVWHDSWHIMLADRLALTIDTSKVWLDLWHLLICDVWYADICNRQCTQLFVCMSPSPGLYQIVFSLIQDRINSLPLSGPHRLSSNDLLCSILWHVSCLVRDRTSSGGTFYLPFDLRQMHVPDAYFGNAYSMLSVLGKLYRISSSEFRVSSCLGLGNHINWIRFTVQICTKKHET